MLTAPARQLCPLARGPEPEAEAGGSDSTRDPMGRAGSGSISG